MNHLKAPKKQTQSNPALSVVEWANFKPDVGFSAYATCRRVVEY
ncbi:MAG TPA: hypothetical protein VMW72_22920 [Sedimentisphaerales bacterium]|nr:hypothetical protein [Sedimentisphaerales bacterium]